MQEDYFSGSCDFGTGGHIFGTEICAASPSEDLTAQSQNHTTLRPQDTAGRDSYDIGGGISHREVEEMIGIAQSLQHDVAQWIRKNHASLL